MFFVLIISYYKSRVPPLLAEFYFNITTEGDNFYYLSPIVAGQPLSPATRHRLGKPLPYQQADRTQVPHQPINLYSNGIAPLETIGYYSFFQRIITRLMADYLRVTHPSAAGLTRSTCIP